MDQKGFANLVLIGIIVILLGVGGYFMSQKKENVKSSQPVTSDTDTSSWKTYTNSKYGFELKYPSNHQPKILENLDSSGQLFYWSISEPVFKEGDVGEFSSSVGISVWDNSKQLTLLDWAKLNQGNSNYNLDNISDFKNETLAGHKAVSYLWRGELSGYGKTVIIENGKTLFVLGVGADNNTESLWQNFDQILSSFKFTQQNQEQSEPFSIQPSVEKDGWLTYQNGAKVILVADNLKSAEVRYHPTGTGITQSTLAGKMSKVSTNRWELKLPASIMSTNFWAETVDVSGKKGKTIDLGNVIYEENDIEKAHNTLNVFFIFLNDEQYSHAIKYYGGDYEVLRDNNPTINPKDYVALIKSGCEQNGFRCLKVKNILKEEQISPTEFKFLVQFMNNDGTLFKKGPCCGASEKDEPTQTSFEYTVKKSGNNFLVLGLPVYTP